MGYTITCQLDVMVPVEVAFDTLADHDSWPEWMPRSFRPVGPSLGTLKPGLAPRVHISGAPFATSLPVELVERPRVITWSGGVSAIAGRHEFRFEPIEGGTRVTSTEVWTGWLAWLFFPFLYPGAHRVGRAQLKGIRTGSLNRVARR